MKMFLSLSFLILSLSAFAQGGGDRVSGGDPISLSLIVEYPASVFDRKPVSRSFYVSSNGSVMKVTSTAGRETRREVLKIKDMKRINQCADELSNRSVILPSDHTVICADDPGVHFKGRNEKAFAIRMCGQLHAVKSKCAQEMVKVLEAIGKLSK